MIAAFRSIAIAPLVGLIGFALVTPTSGEAVGNDGLAVKPRGALMRSAILPGWGQLHNDRSMKALLFAGTASGFLTSTVLEIRSLRDAKTAVERETRSNRRNTRFLYLGLTATIAAIDAYVDAHLAGFDRIGVEGNANVLYLKIAVPW